VDVEQRDGRAAWLTMVTLLPLVVVGVALIASDSPIAQAFVDANL
jgi:hypothetical protein